MSLRPIFCSLCLSVALTACSQADTVEQADAWQIDYKISGGIAGIVQGLSIGHDGHYRVYDQKRRLQRQQLARPEQISDLAEQIRRIANGSHSQQANETPRNRCADCITQQLVIDYKGDKFSHKSRPGRPPSAGYHVLLKQLSTLLKQGLAD